MTLHWANLKPSPSPFNHFNFAFKAESEVFQNVRRTVLVLTPKQALYDWANSIEPIDLKELGQIIGEPDVYLLPDFDTTEQMERWLRTHFDWFFCGPLNNWYTDEDLWVQNRTFKMFKVWFDYILHTMVWVSQKGPIEKIAYFEEDD